MTEADATEREELDVPFPVAITRQNIKTELNEIKKKKKKKYVGQWLDSDVCGLYTDKE